MRQPANPPASILVFGATGQTGRRFTTTALEQGQNVRALVRDPTKLPTQLLARAQLDVHQGSISDPLDFDRLLDGVDAVVCMLGDAARQRTEKINTAFVERLVPHMRGSAVRRLLYQAGGLSAPPGKSLPPTFWAIRKTIARGYEGQHQDNEAVMSYLTDHAADIEWMVHRAGIGSDRPSRGVLKRSTRRASIATFSDCATYSHHLLTDVSAIHTCDTSAYQ